MRRFSVICLVQLALYSAAYGQSTQQPAPNQAPPSETVTPPTVAAEPIAPYDDKLLRLSEVLGSIHYLRTLCGAKEGTKWRDAMNAILVSENPGPKRKARLIARFNRGFRSFNGVYKSCTQSALLASARYVNEGAELSAQITGRYGR